MPYNEYYANYQPIVDGKVKPIIPYRYYCLFDEDGKPIVKDDQSPIFIDSNNKTAYKAEAVFVEARTKDEACEAFEKMGYKIPNGNKSYVRLIELSKDSLCRTVKEE